MTKLSKAVAQDWSSVLQEAVPQGVAAEYGRIHILYKQEGLAEDYELIIAGYASPQIIDREKHLITKEAIKADLPRFLAHPHYRNSMIVHCAIAGTQVKVGPGHEQYKNIEDVVPGDRVYTHKARLREVTAISAHEHEGTLIELTLESGEVLRVTPNHRLLTTKGWVKAKDITTSHILNHLVKKGHRSWKLEESTGYNGHAIVAGLPRVETLDQYELRMARLLETKYGSLVRGNGAQVTAEQRRGRTLAEAYGEDISMLWITRIAESQRGEKSHFWRGGVSRRPYGAGFSKAVRDAVRERDGYSCTVCGRTEAEELRCHGRRLSVDHIDWNKQNHDPENLRSLCVACHGARNGEARAEVANGVAIVGVKEIQFAGLVYNLEVKDDNSYAGRGCIHHNSNIQVGEVLPEWTNPKTGEKYETKVDDIGLFVVVKIRTDKYRPEICGKVEEDIKAGKLAAFSISGDAPFDSRRHVCNNGTCFWIIDKIIFYEVTICEQGVNQDAKFAVLSKMAHCTDGSCPLPLPGYVTNSAIKSMLLKGRTYLAPDEEAPEGMHVEQGPRGGRYYEGGPDKGEHGIEPEGLEWRNVHRTSDSVQAEVQLRSVEGGKLLVHQYKRQSQRDYWGMNAMTAGMGTGQKGSWSCERSPFMTAKQMVRAAPLIQEAVSRHPERDGVRVKVEDAGNGRLKVSEYDFDRWSEVIGHRFPPGTRKQDVFGKRTRNRSPVHKAGGSAQINPITPMEGTEAGDDPTKPDIGGEKAGGGATSHGNIPRGKLEQAEKTVSEDFAMRLWRSMGRPHDFNQFRQGLGVEWEHANVLGGNWQKVAAVVLDHLNEDEQYYTKLAQVEKAGFTGGGGGGGADVGSGYAVEVHDPTTAGRRGGMMTDRHFDEAEDKCPHGVAKGDQTWGPPDMGWSGKDDEEKEDKHSTAEPHAHGAPGALPKIPEIHRPKPLKPAGVTYKSGRPMGVEYGGSVPRGAVPMEDAADLQKVYTPEHPYGGIAPRDDEAGGEESEEYYLNKGLRCPLCQAQSVIENALDNRTLYGRMSGEFRGILRHCLMVLQSGTGGLDWAQGGGFIALSDDHAYTGYMRPGYAIPLTLALTTVGISAFDIGDAALVKAATDTANLLLDQHPVEREETWSALGTLVRKLATLLNINENELLREMPVPGGTGALVRKGYSVGWLGDAQRTLESVKNALGGVNRDALEDDLKVALESITEDVEHLVSALGLTEQMKGQVKGVEPAALDVVREVAKDTEGDVTSADQALEAIDPERIEQRGDSEKDVLDNPDQTIHPKEANVMTGTPPGAPTGNPNASVIHRDMDGLVARLLGWLPPENKLRELYEHIFGAGDQISGPDEFEQLIVQWGQEQARADSMHPPVRPGAMSPGFDPMVQAPELQKAMMPPGYGTTQKTDDNFDLWGAPNRSQQNRGPGRSHLGPTTEEFDTLDQGQHPAYEFSGPTRPEAITKDVGAPTAGMPEADVAVNRGVATDENPKNPLTVAPFEMGPHEPRKPDPRSTAGNVEEKDTGARNDRYMPDPSRVRNARIKKDPALDDPVHVEGAGADKNHQFEDQGPPGEVDSRQPIREREFDNRGAIVPQLNMGYEDVKGLFKLHASLWSRYVHDKHFGLAVVELNDDGEPTQIIDVAQRQHRGK